MCNQRCLSQKLPLCLLGFFMFVSCGPKENIFTVPRATESVLLLTLTPTATNSPEPIPTMLPTLTPPLELQLTYIVELETGTYGLYAIPIGCLEEAFPCQGEPELLFEYPYIFYEVSWSPDGQRVAFASIGIGEERKADIFISDWNGQNIVNITESREFDGRPAWSPDGSRIAYDVCSYEGCQIYSADPDGSNRTQLLTLANVNSPSQPNWSPDGNRLVFIGYNEAMNPAHIYVANLDGSALVQLTHASEDSALPAFSPDGEWIVFQRYVSTGVLGGSEFKIFLIRSDGTSEVLLTQEEVADPSSWPEIICAWPVWSPIGDWIAFNMDSYSSLTLQRDQSDIYLIKPDGTSLINVTGTPDIIELGLAWRRVVSP